ncbi:MAG: hypothetical protein ACRED5_03545 [Propylenella sp.]
MRIAFRSALFGAMMLAPATAFAWWPFQPELPEQAARDIAYEHGIVAIEDIHPTVDADWKVEGFDPYRQWIELVIDGRTGAIERAEMNAN